MLLRLCAILFALALVGSSALASVTVGGLRYSISAVHRATTIGPDLMESHASGEYIIVRLTVTNVGREPADISDSDFHLKAGNTSFDASSEGITAGGFFLQKLNPGVSHTGNVVFDVPANTSPAKYKLVVYGNGDGESREISLR